MSGSEKNEGAFRTIREVADWLGVPTHVLRFWESKFEQIAPVKGAGGRRYYRPEDMRLLGGIKVMLHDQGLTIRGVSQKIADEGAAQIMELSPPLEGGGAVAAPKTRRVVRPSDGADAAPEPAKAEPDAPGIDGDLMPDQPIDTPMPSQPTDALPSSDPTPSLPDGEPGDSAPSPAPRPETPSVRDLDPPVEEPADDPAPPPETQPVDEDVVEEMPTAPGEPAVEGGAPVPEIDPASLPDAPADGPAIDLPDPLDVAVSDPPPGPSDDLELPDPDDEAEDEAETAPPPGPPPLEETPAPSVIVPSPAAGQAAPPAEAAVAPIVTSPDPANAPIRRTGLSSADQRRLRRIVRKLRGLIEEVEADLASGPGH